MIFYVDLYLQFIEDFSPTTYSSLNILHQIKISKIQFSKYHTYNNPIIQTYFVHTDVTHMY